ncbi:MAG: S24 family peptidase [Armatimonadota bacterium]
MATDSLGEFILNRLGELDMTQADLQRVSGLSGAEISRIISGKRKQPSQATLLRMASPLRVEPVTLYRLAGYHVEEHRNGHLRSGLRQIPIVGRIACGEPMLAEEHVEGTISLPEEILPPGEVIAIRMVGDSMERAGLRDGDFALVKVQEDVESGEIAAVCIGDDRGEATIKRFRCVDGFIMLLPDSDNKAYQPIARHPDQVHIVGKVAGVWWG